MAGQLFRRPAVPARAHPAGPLQAAVWSSPRSPPTARTFRSCATQVITPTWLRCCGC